ncbi:MAG: hypothetical protein HXS52_05455 [Theionarchaea archaeon]|nr:hypothetical protein [Theionarchaea archaeon]MBU7037356.1 hypothetical protein [Theionarchaea archaeon]
MINVPMVFEGPALLANTMVPLGRGTNVCCYNDTDGDYYCCIKTEVL